MERITSLYTELANPSFEGGQIGGCGCDFVADFVFLCLLCVTLWPHVFWFETNEKVADSSSSRPAASQAN